MRKYIERFTYCWKHNSDNKCFEYKWFTDQSRVSGGGYKHELVDDEIIEYMQLSPPDGDEMLLRKIVNRACQENKLLLLARMRQIQPKLFTGTSFWFFYHALSSKVSGVELLDWLELQVDEPVSSYKSRRDRETLFFAVKKSDSVEKFKWLEMTFDGLEIAQEFADYVFQGSSALHCPVYNLSKHFMEFHPGLFDFSKINLATVCYSGNAKLLKLLAPGREADLKSMIKSAGYTRNTDVLREIRALYPNSVFSDILDADEREFELLVDKVICRGDHAALQIVMGNMDRPKITRFLTTLQQSDTLTEWLNVSICEGHTAIAEWLMDIVPETRFTSTAFDIAACFGHVNILEYLYKLPYVDDSFTPSVTAATFAVYYGHLDVIKWLYRNKPCFENMNFSFSLSKVKRKPESAPVCVKSLLLECAVYDERADIVCYMLHEVIPPGFRLQPSVLDAFCTLSETSESHDIIHMLLQQGHPFSKKTIQSTKDQVVRDMLLSYEKTNCFCD